MGLIRALLAATILLPLAFFAASAALGWREDFAEAARDAARIAEVAREHAAKILDGQSLVADRVDDLLRPLTPQTAEAAEQRLHEEFVSIVIRRPEVQGVLLAATDGTPLATALSYPVPHDRKVSDRAFFKAIVDQRLPLYVTPIETGNISAEEFIGLAQPWLGPHGELFGVTDVAVSPAQFEDFFAAIVSSPERRSAGYAITMAGPSGRAILRYPALAQDSRPAPIPGLAAAIAANADGGAYWTDTGTAGGVRLLTYRKVPDFPIYVIAGRSRSAIIQQWLGSVERQLAFGLPATIALAMISWLALIRTRREQRALEQSRIEIARREKAEATLLRTQRLEAVGQLTGGIAHDFNNLLTVILVSGESVQRHANDPERVNRLAEQITLAAKRGGDVTQQLLAFSRRQFSSPQVVDLNACLQEFEPLLQRAATERSTLVLELDPASPHAKVDPGHLQAAILNLVGNARDAMPRGGTIRIATRLERVPLDTALDLQAGEYAVLSVQDQGTGMDADTAAKAFEPFFTTKGVGHGTGLGLSQVYGFVKQAGGDASIDTKLGQGTTVELFLPSERARASF